jgi:hypothetical protein
MPANQFDQSQQPAQSQSTTVQETVHTALTVTTDRTLNTNSAMELERLEEATRRIDYGMAFGM